MFLYDPMNSRDYQQTKISYGLTSKQTEHSSTIIINHTQVSTRPLTGFFNSTSTRINLSGTSVNYTMVPTTIDALETADIPHHQIMLLILLAIFTTISVSISLSVIIFCRKKNTVFMLQKCEQESDVEMDDLPTEIENSDVSDSDDVKTVIKKSRSYPLSSKYSRANNLQTHNLSQDKGTQYSSSLMPLLRKPGLSQEVSCYIQRSEDKSSTSKCLHKSRSFPCQQECHRLLKKPRILLKKEYDFGSITDSKESNQTQEKKLYAGTLLVTTSIQSDLEKAGQKSNINESVCTDTDDELNVHGKLELI